MSDWIRKVMEDNQQSNDAKTDRRDERDAQARTAGLLRDFAGNADALAAFHGVDVDGRPHERVLDHVKIVGDLIWDCSAIPEELRESFWDDLQELDTESRHVVENIKDFTRQLLQFADRTNPDLEPILSALQDMLMYARLMF